MKMLLVLVAMLASLPIHAVEWETGPHGIIGSIVLVEEPLYSNWISEGHDPGIEPIPSVIDVVAYGGCVVEYQPYAIVLAAHDHDQCGDPEQWKDSIEIDPEQSAVKIKELMYTIDGTNYYAITCWYEVPQTVPPSITFTSSTYQFWVRYYVFDGGDPVPTGDTGSRDDDNVSFYFTTTRFRPDVSGICTQREEPTTMPSICDN